jgi:hypothetical protein
MMDEQLSMQSNLEEAECLGRKLGVLDLRQVAIWRRMSPARRLELAFQAYQFALEMVRVTEHRRHPELASDELAWHIVERLHGSGMLVDRNPH